MTKAISIAALIIIALLMTPFSVSAQVYKWIDDKGDVHFTDDYSSIPEKYRPVPKLNDRQKKTFLQASRNNQLLLRPQKPLPPRRKKHRWC